MPPPPPPPNQAPMSLPDPDSFAAPLSPASSSSLPPFHASPVDTSPAPWVRRHSPSLSSARRLHNPFYRIPRLSRQQDHSNGNERVARRFALIASAEDPRVILGRCISAGNKFLTHTGRAFLALTIPQRIAVVMAALVVSVVSAAFLVYSHKIFEWLYPMAESWRTLPAGWLIIFMLSTATAFPPLIGYSTVVAISGFLYGFPGGWPVVAAANVMGSTLSLVLCRTVFSARVDRLVGNDARFVALGQVLRRDGLGMLTMIRICPLPYSLSNGFLAQVKTVKPWAFAVATGLASPKLLIHVFIGSRLAILADQGDTMSAGDKAVNYISMAMGAILGLVVSWLIYRRTMSRAAELAASGQPLDGHAPSYLEHSDEAEVEAAQQILRGAAMDDGAHDDAYDNYSEWLGHTDLESGRHGQGGESDTPALGLDDDDISLWETREFERGRYRDEEDGR